MTIITFPANITRDIIDYQLANPTVWIMPVNI